MSGGRYLAEDRGAFDAIEVVEAATGEAVRAVATAPLYEVAAAHDGQGDAAVAWLAMFKRVYGGR